MMGKSTEWMGTGWGSNEMENTYTIVADGTGYGVGEWRLDSKDRGHQLKPTIAVISNTVDSGVRTVCPSRDGRYGVA